VNISNDIDYIEFSSIDSEFEDFVYIYIYSKYSVLMEESFGQNPSKNLTCYSNVMNSLICNKYGKDIIKRSRKEAKEIYLKKSETEKAKVIDLNNIYSLKLQSQPKFIGNDRVLIDYFRKEIKTEIKTEETLYSNFITLILDENGIVVDIYLIENSNEINSKKEKLLLEINKLGSFVPAFLYGTKVKSKMFFYY